MPQEESREPVRSLPAGGKGGDRLRHSACGAIGREHARGRRQACGWSQACDYIDRSCARTFGDATGAIFARNFDGYAIDAIRATGFSILRAGQLGPGRSGNGCQQGAVSCRQASGATFSSAKLDRNGACRSFDQETGGSRR